jgi:hypothetical protein
MKLIHVVLIIAIFGLAVGRICDGYEFTEIRSRYVFFTGNLNFATSFDKSKAISLAAFKITNINEGRIYYTKGSRKIDKFYLSPRLHCDTDESKKSKVCLLQYISLNAGIFYLNQIQFKYTILLWSMDCETELRQKLNDNIVEHSKVKYFETDYQIFSLNFKKNGKTKKLNFNTKTMKFRWENENADLERVEINSGKELTELKGVVDKTINFQDGTIQSVFIKKIQTIFHECTDEADLYYYYFDLTRHSPEGKEYDYPPMTGKIVLDPEYVTMPAIKGKAFSILDYEIAKSSFPIYEKYNLKLTLQDEVADKYTLFVRIPSRQCLNKALELLARHPIGCSEKAPTSLNYSKVVNLRKEKEEEVTPQGVIKGLNFKADEVVIEEREGNNLSLKLVINKINVYDLELDMTSKPGEYWVYIKGADLESKIINKKYLLKITGEQQHCLKRLQNLEEEMFGVSAKHGKIFLWQIVKGNDANILVNQDGIGSEGFKPLAVIDTKRQQIAIQGQGYRRRYKELELNKDNGLKVILEQNEELIFEGLNERCSKRLTMLLSPEPAVLDANSHIVPKVALKPKKPRKAEEGKQELSQNSKKEKETYKLPFNNNKIHTGRLKRLKITENHTTLGVIDKKPLLFEY